MMNTVTHTLNYDAYTSDQRGIGAFFTRMILRVLRWQELAAQRRILLSLDDHMLKDIGISRADALYEAQRPFWEDPQDERDHARLRGLL